MTLSLSDLRARLHNRRSAVILGLVGLAGVHVMDLPAKFEETPYLGWAYILIILFAAVVVERLTVKGSFLDYLGAAGVSLAVLGVSQWNSMLADAVFLFVAGFAWSVLVISHQVAVLTTAPDGMRGLITSFYALTVQGSLAAGSFLFGAIAQHIGCSRSIMLAGLVAMGGLALVRRFPLSDGSAS
jgi:predicted MFS family arabinose efflux permease